MENIEVEVRSFISKSQYDELCIFFHENAEFLKEDSQETFYFDSKEDVRIQKNDFFAKIWMKKGNLHDDHREEIEIRFDTSDFENLEKVFKALGTNVAIKWFRKRIEFLWDDITVCLDDTRGYGYIIELEKMSSEQNKETELKKLQEKFVLLNIIPTPKEEFNQQFLNYKENWKILTGEK